MGLKVVNDFEHAADKRRFDGKEDKLAAGLENAGGLAQALIERDVFEDAA